MEGRRALETEYTADPPRGQLPTAEVQLVDTDPLKDETLSSLYEASEAVAGLKVRGSVYCYINAKLFRT